MFLLRSDVVEECWSGEVGPTGTGTGEAIAVRELIEGSNPLCESLALGLREGRRDEGADEFTALY